MKTQKILIIGAGGYIGSVSADLFLQKGYEVVAADNFSRGFRGPLEFLEQKYSHESFRYYECSLGDISRVFQKEPSITAVINYAALCNVAESMAQPGAYFENNTCGVLALLQAMTEYKVANLIFSSTCAVYGQSQYLPLDEKHPFGPISPYGESKLLAEKMIRWFAELKGLRYAVLRYFNVCGASDDSSLGDSKKPSYHLMQNAVRAALGIAPFSLECPEVDTPDKTPIRDYVDVVDLNEAHVLALEYLLNGGVPDAFNIGTGKGNSVLEIVEAVQAATGKKFELTKGATRQGDPARLFASNEKAKKILGWNPNRSIEHSVKTLVEWYKKHPQGWEK